MIYLAAAIVVLTLIAMASGKVPAVLALGCGLAAAAITGVAEPASLFAGLSNGGVITVAGMLVIAKGVIHTGVVTRVTWRLLHTVHTAGQTLRRLVGPVGILSALINTTPIVAMLIPAVKELQQTAMRHHRLGWAAVYIVVNPLLFCFFRWITSHRKSGSELGAKLNLRVGELPGGNYRSSVEKLSTEGAIGPFLPLCRSRYPQQSKAGHLVTKPPRRGHHAMTGNRRKRPGAPARRSSRPGASSIRTSQSCPSLSAGAVSGPRGKRCGCR